MTVFDVSDRSRDLRHRLTAFMEEHIYPCLLYTSPSPRD